MREATINYYNQNAGNLSEGYISADMESLHNRMSEFFSGCENVFELGTGSGRDMSFMLNRGFNVYGCEASEKMLKLSLENFPLLEGRVEHCILPESFPHSEIKFDAFYSIATLMHFTSEELPLLLNEIKTLLNKKAKLLFSVSEPREYNADARYFNKLSKDDYKDLFTDNGFEIIDIKTSLEEDRNIKWNTFYLKFTHEN